MRVCSFCQRCFDDAVVSCSEDDHPPLSETRGGFTEMVPGYRLEFALDSGLRGDRFRARQIACGRSCLITIRSIDPGISERFLEEAKLAATLFHPNLADVYEAGSLETGECFVVSEDPADETLRCRLRSAGVPKLLDTIELVRQTAEALHAVHLKGFTHRALRPENIILTTDPGGQPQVRVQNVDFAGVSERAIISNKFLIDSAIDSLRYFSPEQCSGEPVGPKTDVYALGIILYEMLAGTPPFDSATAAGVIEKHRSHRPPDIRIDNFELRMLITHTLMESLHKRPDKRQSTANAFARQLRHIEQLATHVSTPPPAGTVKIRPRDADRPATFAAPAASPPPVPTTAPKSRPVREVHAVDPVHAVHDTRPDIEPEPQRSGPSLAEDLGTRIVNFVRETSSPAISHFSRLKQRRKKQQPRAEPPSTREPEIKPETGTAPEKNAPKTFSAEAAAIRLASELNAVAELRSKAKPKKVEWGLAEDDIPSIKDTGATGIEHIAVHEVPEVPPSVTATEDSAPVQTRASTIQWTEPEDDIPSLADAQQVLIREPAPEARIAVETKMAPVLEAPPNVAAATLQGEEAPIAAEPLPEPVQAQITPPVGDSRAEATITAVAPEQAAETAAEEISPAPMEPTIESRPEQPAVAEEPLVVAKSERPAAQPVFGKTRPVVPTPAKAPVVDPNFAPAFQLRPRGIRVSGLQSRPTPVATLDDIEEITLVSPTRSRFRVPVNMPQPVRKHTPARRVVPIPSTEAVFIPTLLGGTVKPATTEPAPADSILTAYYPTPGTRSVPYRSITIGTGFVALIALFLFAGDSLWNTSTATSGETVSANPPSTRSLPATVPAGTTLPAKKNSFKAPDRPVTKESRDTRDDETSEPKQPTAAEKNTSRARSESSPRRVEPPAEKRPTPKPEPSKPVVEKKPQPITVRSNGATRPRIVQERN